MSAMAQTFIWMLVLVNVNPQIQEMVDNVSQDSILACVQRLQDFITRYPTHDSCFAAADWIQSEFLAIGMDSVYRDSFTWTYVVPPNIVGIKRGIVYPESCYTLVCAHYDAYSPNPDSARGADDNGSGVAAVLEAARVMSNYQFEYNIRFIAFSTEEFGDIGSEHYASNALLNGDSITGVFNYDMIGYSDALPESIEVIAEPFCEPLIDLFIACADTYTTLYATKMIDAGFGDAYQFSIRGYQAITMIEDWPLTNPYYHWRDTIGSGFNDLDLCTEVARAGIASLASLAIPVGIMETEVPVITQRDVIIITPNPFHDRVKIQYTLHDNGLLTGTSILCIYDATGRLVKSFKQVSGTQNRETCVYWDGYDDANRRLNSGVYFLTLQAGDHSITRKILFVR